MPTDDFPEKFDCVLFVFFPFLVFLTNKKITVQVYLSKYYSCNIDDSKGIIKTASRRRTDNALAKRKGTKGQTTIFKPLHRKIKIEQHEPH